MFSPCSRLLTAEWPGLTSDHAARKPPLLDHNELRQSYLLIRAVFLVLILQGRFLLICCSCTPEFRTRLCCLSSLQNRTTGRVMQRQRGLQQTCRETIAGSGEEPEATQGRNSSGTMIRLKRRFSIHHGTPPGLPPGPGAHSTCSRPQPVEGQTVEKHKPIVPKPPP